MIKNPLDFIDHIEESIKNIEEYTKEVNKENFLKDKKLQDAVVRRLEVIGEAVRNIPLEFRAKYPEIKWKKIAGMRDFLIHEYFGVDLELVWEVVEKDLPTLKLELQKIH